MFTSQNGCRFKGDCAYNHKIISLDGEQTDLKERVEALEKEIVAANIKKKIEEVKKNEKHCLKK